MKAGEFIKSELTKKNISASELSKLIGMIYNNLNAILNDKRRISPRTALLIENSTGISAEKIMELQASEELETARQQLKGGDNV